MGNVLYMCSHNVFFPPYFLDALIAFANGEKLVSGSNATAMIWATYPQHFLSVGSGFLDQVGEARARMVVCVCVCVCVCVKMFVHVTFEFFLLL